MKAMTFTLANLKALARIGGDTMLRVRCAIDFYIEEGSLPVPLCDKARELSNGIHYADLNREFLKDLSEEIDNQMPYGYDFKYITSVAKEEDEEEDDW